MASPSCTGDVSITTRGWPLLRPFVVSSTTGIPPARHPSRPPLILSRLRWKVFMAFSCRSLGMRRTLRARGPCPGRTVGQMQHDLASLVPALLQSSSAAAIVELCGSRASGTAGRYSDWDFRVATHDFAVFASELPGLVQGLDPLVEQWDRLSDEACFMLIVRGPAKVDLIFPDVPHDHEPPWVVDSSTLSG